MYDLRKGGSKTPSLRKFSTYYDILQAESWREGGQNALDVIYGGSHLPVQQQPSPSESSAPHAKFRLFLATSARQSVSHLSSLGLDAYVADHHSPLKDHRPRRHVKITEEEGCETDPDSSPSLLTLCGAQICSGGEGEGDAIEEGKDNRAADGEN